jgi:hypothetical protein
MNTPRCFTYPAWITGLALVVALAPGCDEQVTDPLPPPAPPADAPSLYPLAVGMTWTYTAHRTVLFLNEDGDEVQPRIEQVATVTREIIATEEVAGLSWAIEEQRFLLDGATTPTVNWRRYREAPTGVYRAELSVNIPPGGADDFTFVESVRRVAYPPEIGTDWLLREGDVRNTGRLIEVQPATTAIGPVMIYLVGYEFSDDGPTDYRLFTYSACGLVRSQVYTELLAYDVVTGELIAIQSTETYDIIDISPACPRRPGMLP